MAGRKWTREELLVALWLYCRTDFGKLHSRNSDIIQIASKLDRTPGAIAMKACNFASLDPSIERKGLGNVSSTDKQLWEQFRADSTMIALEAESSFNKLVAPETERETISKERLVQRFFRKAVLESYENRCAVTGMRKPELLNAGHIIPWRVSKERRADPTNGIALNALHDRAFDRGLITFDEGLRLVLSPLLGNLAPVEVRKHFFSRFEGREIMKPERFHPDTSALEYHRKNVFLEG
ncbi:MAG: HNH endonuclease [Planctomycetota bacterium]|nr:HNH endonuclease [Planctomycetota bacterium]